MKQGVLIFAYNSSEVDYGKQAIISAGLAKKHLGVPVSLVTDKWTVRWLNDSGLLDRYSDIFDQIIETELPESGNKRRLYDGNNSSLVPFNNSNRCSAWDLTPYDRTLMIDSDFLIFSDRLNEYWNVDSSVLISRAMNDIHQSRAGTLDKWISFTGSNLFWATTVMFTKNEESKFFFDLVEFVKRNYNYYAELYRFDPKQYRNDISFSIALHIINGFTESDMYTLPDIVTTTDRDVLHDVRSDGTLLFTIDSDMMGSQYIATTLSKTDVHVMNKQSIVRNFDRLVKLI